MEVLQLLSAGFCQLFWKIQCALQRILPHEVTPVQQDLEEKDHWAVCRTAPATQGLLNTAYWRPMRIVQQKPRDPFTLWLLWQDFRVYKKNMENLSFQQKCRNQFNKLCLIVNFRYCVKILTFWNCSKFFLAFLALSHNIFEICWKWLTSAAYNQ